MEIESYLLKDLSEKENKNPRTIKSSFRYIPIKIYSPTITKRFEAGKQRTPYSTRYIKLEDIQKALKGKVDFNFITKK